MILQLAIALALYQELISFLVSTPLILAIFSFSLANVYVPASSSFIPFSVIYLARSFT